jgi:cytochrome d ubiquinol oxidase subunit II
MGPIPDLPVVFAAVAAFCVVVYVLADGFDLGVGILFLFAPRDRDRDLMMASLEPVWDCNETWLVMGGTLLLATFPAGYYVLLPAFYLPIMAMLFALILRGVAFQFRQQSEGVRQVWDFAFAGGSLLATLCQGMILGGLINGIAVHDGVYAGGSLDCVSVLGLACGLGLVGGYSLLGAGWLIWKTDGLTQVFAREATHSALILTTVMMLAVSAWSAWSVAEVAERWFAGHNIDWLAPIPILTAAALLTIWRRIWTGRETDTFLLAILIFLFGFAGLVVSLWPYVVPRSVSIWDGAADPKTLAFVGSGLVVIIPIVLIYQARAYWVFRGKVRPSAGYSDISVSAVDASRTSR